MVADMTERHILKLIGCWAPLPRWQVGDGDKEPPWPDIRRAVLTGWHATEREQLVAYLRNGHCCRAFFGYSACRFECRETYSELGCGDLTDGEWIWPEGLPHYVERHGVMLPEEFVASASARAWKVPPLEQVGAKVTTVFCYSPLYWDEAQDRISAGGDWRPDFSFWLEWAKALPEAPRGQPPADPGTLKKFCLVLEYPSMNGCHEAMETFHESMDSIWNNVAGRYGRGVPTVEDPLIEWFSIEHREAVIAAVLDGLRHHGLEDRVTVICGEPDPNDWQRDRDVVVWPQGGAAELTMQPAAFGRG